MRKRNIAILFRLNRKEAEALDKRVKKSGLNREAYLRQLINGLVPRNAPPPDYYSMMRELHQIGNNLNQIAQKAHVLNVIDVQRYDREVRKFRQAVEQITEAVVLPERVELQIPEQTKGQSWNRERKSAENWLAERADQRTADQREHGKWQ